MYLKQLSLVNFKNHEQAELEFIDGVNCFTGNNGVGKTNVLDAIYYLSFCKSYFNPVDSQNIRYDEQFFVVQGEFELDDYSERIYCGLKKGQKKTFKRNKKEYDRLADHIGLLPLVIISPNDSSLIYDGSEIRRKFMDGVIAQYDKSYLDNLLSYGKAVQQRNALLKQFAKHQYFDPTSIEVWDMKMIQFGTPIFEARKKFLEEFIPLFRKYFVIISGGREEVDLVYDSKLNEIVFEELIRISLPKDQAVQYTTAGVHKDDLAFSINGKPIKKFGSQGQQKSFLVAVKLAQFEFIHQLKGKKPLLLLDDIFDKLDKQRVKALLKLVSENSFGQIFITDANKERIDDLLDEIGAERKIYHISDNGVNLV